MCVRRNKIENLARSLCSLVIVLKDFWTISSFDQGHIIRITKWAAVLYGQNTWWTNNKFGSLVTFMTFILFWFYSTSVCHDAPPPPPIHTLWFGLTPLFWIILFAMYIYDHLLFETLLLMSPLCNCIAIIKTIKYTSIIPRWHFSLIHEWGSNANRNISIRAITMFIFTINYYNTYYN